MSPSAFGSSGSRTSRSRACLLAANHKSYLDPLAVGCPLRRELRYFAKKELFRIPIFGTMVRIAGAIPVDRRGFDRAAIHEALGILRGGQGMLVFPEGTRIRRPALAVPKDGVAMLAIQADVPVIPVWVGHTWEPRRTLFRRIPVEVRYGAALRFPAGGTAAEKRARYPEVSRAIMEAIAGLASEPVAVEPAP
ncbi:MAG: lysophospholipid acyltransferase family protein [Candidatus Eisenbacteria bacterium]